MNGYTRIIKKQARNTYNNGQHVALVACKIAPDDNGTWIQPIDIDNDRLDGYDFDDFVNNFEYYNCMYETGYYAAYYIKE
jgi:hypothetical protein